MFQVRIHGRGGQGVVSGAEMLSVAAFLEGKYAQAFPSFGSERMGAPVVAFCRIDEKEIRLREPVMTPDALIVQDPTLLHQVDLFSGLDAAGYVLINTARGFDELGLGEFSDRFPPHHIRTVRATELGREYVGRPVSNAAGLDLPIVMTVGNRAIGAPINIWNDHSANWGRVSRVSRWASPSGSSPSTQFRVDPSQCIQPVLSLNKGGCRK